jgi:transcriptional regulator with XRE-family HTH domain
LELDYEAVSQDLVRALRGDRSQTAFARRLGYRSNAVYTWEAGKRFPTGSVFLRAAGRVGVDVPGALRAFLRADPPWLAADPATPEGVAALLCDLRGDVPLGPLAARAGRSRFAVSRWLKGQAEPRLPDLLRMVEATSLRALDFVGLFADPERLPSTAAAWERLATARTLAWSNPWSQVVLLALELAPYRALPVHDDGWLAARVGLEVDAVAAALDALVRAGQVVHDGVRYRPVAIQAVDVRSPVVGSALKRFWVDVARQRLADGAPGAWSYNVFAVSEADLQRLEEMQRAHYRAIRALVAESSPAERVVLIHLQTVPLA